MVVDDPASSQKVSMRHAGSKTEHPCKGDLYPHCDTTIWLRSCDKEELQPLEGLVKGIIPSWVEGSLLRNGPGSLKVGDMEYNHLFDCAALLHRFHIADGKVTYQNRFLQSETYKKNQAAQRIVVTEFGTSSVPDPCQTIFKRVAAVFTKADTQSDNAMISVYPIGDKFFALTESPIVLEIDPEDLSTGKRVHLGQQLGIVNHTSHPHVLQDGTVYNLGMIAHSTGLQYCVVKFPEGVESASIVAKIPARWNLHPSYMHTFGITDRWFVIVEQPLSVSVAGVVTGAVLNRPLREALRWFEDSETLIYLVSRETGKVCHSFTTDAFFYLHIINQFEDDDRLVLDICCYRDPSMIDCMYIAALKEAQHNPDYANKFRGRPLRFVLPLKTDISKNGNISVRPELLCTLGCETPRINYDRFLGRKYRFFYGISSDVDLENPGTLIKVDTVLKKHKTWCEPNLFPSEPVFVPRPGATAEDDGVVLTAVVWGGELDREVGLVVLDAATWTELGRATFTARGPVPKCLHGWFVGNRHPQTQVGRCQVD